MNYRQTPLFRERLPISRLVDEPQIQERLYLFQLRISDNHALHQRNTPHQIPVHRGVQD